jgi:hypothetical protein
MLRRSGTSLNSWHSVKVWCSGGRQPWHVATFTMRMPRACSLATLEPSIFSVAAITCPVREA